MVILIWKMGKLTNFNLNQYFSTPFQMLYLSVNTKLLTHIINIVTDMLPERINNNIKNANYQLVCTVWCTKISINALNQRSPAARKGKGKSVICPAVIYAFALSVRHYPTWNNPGCRYALPWAVFFLRLQRDNNKLFNIRK